MEVRHRTVLLVKYVARGSPVRYEPIGKFRWPGPWIRLIIVSAIDGKVFQCPPSLLQIFPSFLGQLATSSLSKYFGQMSDVNDDLIRKVIDILLRLRNFLGGCDMMSMGGKGSESAKRHHLRFLAERGWSLLLPTTWLETGYREWTLTQLVVDLIQGCC